MQEFQIKDQGKRTGAKNAPGTRVYKRVRVSLKAIVFGEGQRAYSALTENISEGGVYLSDYLGPPLAAGETVRVSLDGVLSDQELANDYAMRVVHQDHYGCGLSFIG